jgi:hypothetical protein
VATRPSIDAAHRVLVLGATHRPQQGNQTAGHPWDNRVRSVDDWQGAQTTFVSPSCLANLRFTRRLRFPGSEGQPKPPSIECPRPQCAASTATFGLSLRSPTGHPELAAEAVARNDIGQLVAKRCGS